MRVSAAKTISIVAVAAVAVLGAAYASAAPNHVAASSKAAVTTTSKVVNSGALKAVPFVTAPKRNIAHVYSTTTTGGTGQLLLTVPTPANGVYAASFTANFFPEGSPAAPETFSCFMTKNGSMLTQSTATSTYTSGFYVGVNGGNTVQVNGSTVLTVGCGVADGTAWTWGTKPVQVTLTRLDGMTTGSLTAPTKKTSPASIAGR